MRCFAPALFIVTAVVLATPPLRAAEKKVKSVLIELDGSASSDADGDSLRYEWRQVAGPKITLSDPHAAKPFFRAIEPGAYVFELRVSDGKQWSQPIQVEVQVEAENLPPEAIIIPEVICEAGQVAVIDGRRSRDPEGDRLLYRWSQISGPPLYLPSEVCQQPILSFPAEQPGVYEIQLVVSDGKNASQPAVCRLTIKPRNTAPVARATSNQRAIIPKAAEERAPIGRRPVAYIEEVGCPLPGETVVLDGRNSFSPARKPLKYYWKQKSGPFVRAFGRPEEGVLTFTASEDGDYEFELTVSDGEQESAPTVRKFRVGREGDAPVAVVMGPQRASVGEEVVLDGSRSFDRSESVLEYLWRQVAGPRILHYVMPKADAADVIAFTPSEPGQYVFELVVANGRRKSRPAQLEIAVVDQPTPLQAKIIAPARGMVGKPLCLEAEAEGGEENIAYTWRQVKGPRLLRGPTSQRSLLMVPQETGVYAFELTAADGERRSHPAKAEIIVCAASEEEKEEVMAAEVMPSSEEAAGAAPPAEDCAQQAMPDVYRRRIRHIFQRPAVIPQRLIATGERNPDISTAAPPELPPASTYSSRRP